MTAELIIPSTTVTILNLKEDYPETSYWNLMETSYWNLCCLSKEDAVSDQLGRCFQEFNGPWFKWLSVESYNDNLRCQIFFKGESVLLLLRKVRGLYKSWQIPVAFFINRVRANEI